MKKRIFSILYMFLLTLLCTGALSVLESATRQKVLQNRQARLEKVVLDVLGIGPLFGPEGREASKLFGRRVKKQIIQGHTFYVGFDDSGKVAGYAFPVGGAGFWGPIKGMMGVKPDFSQVTGLVFYEHNETPGLGGRISEPWFSAQFSQKPLSVRNGRYFELVPPGTAKGPSEVDAITGATQTSTRLEKFLNKDIKDYLDFLKKYASKTGGALAG